MKIITTEDFAKATKLDKLHMPGLAALLMELMKINQVNDLFAQAQAAEQEEKQQTWFPVGVPRRVCLHFVP